jgi:signal peptidase I
VSSRAGTRKGRDKPAPAAQPGSSTDGGGARGKLRLRRGEAGPKRSKSTPAAILELVLIIAVALGLALAIQAWVVKPYRIPSGSMEPTLAVGQRVLVNRIGMQFSDPHVGEIAVFHPPRDAEQQVCGPTPHVVKPGGAACAEPEPAHSGVNFIKRIVGGPGDEIYIREGHVFRKPKGKSSFEAEKDSYIKPCPTDTQECNFPTPIKIPPGHWFMMGDNRGESDDSRFWGPVPKGWIIGGAFATYWPLDRIGIL